MQQLKKVIVAITGFVLPVALSCMQQPVAPVPDGAANDANIIAGNCTATYTVTPTNEQVQVSWNEPAQPVNFYRVYRTNVTLPGNIPDTSTMVSMGLQRYIPAGTTTFNDLVGLANTVYWYAVRTALVVPHTVVATDGVQDIVYDTIEGPLSNYDSCQVISPISFAINGGDLFIAIDVCEISFIDRLNQVDAITLTDTFAFDTVPVFGPNPRNLRVDYTVGDSLYVLWALPKRSGTKKVAARVQYTAGASLVDTTEKILTDDILIRPYRVDIKFRNKPQRPEPNPEMNVDQLGYLYKYTIFRPWVDFSISIFSDGTFEKELEYWLVFPDTNSVLTSTPKKDKTAWLETQPRVGALTGYGSDHNDLAVYRYSIDVNDPSGIENLSAVRRTVAQPFDTAFYRASELSNPGSYWGDSTDSKNASIWTTVRNSPSQPNSAQQNYKRVLQLLNKDWIDIGRKEFSVVVRLRGRYFQDVRTVQSSFLADKVNGQTGAYFDCAPPRVLLTQLTSGGVWRIEGTAECPIEGAEIRSPFRVSLPGARDLAGSDISLIQFGIAQMPPGMAEQWLDNPSTTANPSKIGQSLTLDSLMNLRHRLYDFTVKVPQFDVTPLFWPPFDPSGWPSGDYLFFFVSYDKSGYGGLSPFRDLTIPTNPWHVRIITGQ